MLKSPGCGNLEVKAGIESDARNSVNGWLGNKAPPADTEYALSNSFETARSGDTRSCAATVTVSRGQDHIAVQIKYDVLADDNGRAMYRWDETEFGKSYVGSAMLQVLQGLSKPAPIEDGTIKPSPDEVTRPPRDNDGSSRRTESQKADNLSGDAQWRDYVSKAVNAQAANFTIDGSGSLFISFDVLATGDIRNVKVERSSGIAGLDATAVQMVEKVGHVSPPPNQQPIRMSMTLSFL